MQMAVRSKSGSLELESGSLESGSLESGSLELAPLELESGLEIEQTS
jgi:hypothetical protein